MEEVDKGCLMLRMGEWVNASLVLAHPGILDKGPLNSCVCDAA